MSNTPATTLELEIMPSSHAAAVELSAPEAKAFALYAHFEKPFALAAELIALGKDVKTPAEAREIRLKLVKARTGIVATKDAAKAGIKLEGDIIQFYHNKAVAKIQAEEARLDEIEKAEERRLAKEREERRVARLAELAAVGMDGSTFPLGEMLAEPYAQLLNGAKLAHEAKIAAEAKAKEEARIAAEKAESERFAREAAERAERERIKAEAERLRIENERLAKEREVAEKAAKAEREAAELAAKIERERVTKEKAEAEAAAKAEREKIEAAAAAALKAEREKAAEAARIEREKREELERAEAVRLAAEKQKLADEQAAAARAAAAPDKEKLAALAEQVKAITFPEMATESGQFAINRIKGEASRLLEAIRAEYKALGKA